MITIYNSNLDFDLNSSNSITLSSTSNMVFKTNGTDKMSIVNNGISVSGNVVVSGLITSTGAGFSGIGANLTNIPISAINELRLELNGSTTDLAVTSNILVSRLVSEIGFGSNYTNRINSELNTRVDNTSNYVLATSNILIGRIINTSNYIDSTSNFLSGRLDNTSNYVFATSNILIGRIINTSNYVDSTSNFLSGRIDNTSNYVFATSNILIGRLINTSNYVDSTSNFLGGRIDNTSNYVFATSNILIGRVINASNYVESTSNILIGRLINTSNYVESTSNLLAGRIDNTSNYVFSTSNILIGRIINTSNYVLATSNILADYNNLINKPFQFNGTNIFNNSGNVGIGTNATPLSLMEIITANYNGALLTLDAGIVNSTTQMPRNIGRPLLKLGKTSVSTSAGDYYGIGFGISPTLSDYNCAEIGTIITSTTGLETGDIIFSTRPGTNNVIATERMRITSSGNVGIGTTDTTTYKLNVGGTLNTTGLYVNGAALTTTLGLKQDVLTSTNTIGVFNTTTDFVVNGDKIELTKNTSNYVIATSNLLSRRIDSTSNYSDRVGVWGSNYTDKADIWGSNYSDRVGGWGSNYAYDKVGVWSSNYSDRVGVWSSNYAYDKVGVWSSNYTDRVGVWGSNYAYDKVGVWSSNYTDRIGERSSNYVLATSNILIGRIVHTSNYVSSYKPATAVRADTADKFTTSRRIANVPFDGSSDISISYNSLDNKLNATTGINIDISNNISANYVSTDLIGIFNTTDFADVNNKIELSNNTSNYVRATSNILIGRIMNTSNYVDSINTSLTAAIVSGGQWISSNANIYYNTSNVGIGTFNPLNKLHIYSSNNGDVINATTLTIQNDFRKIITSSPPVISYIIPDTIIEYMVFVCKPGDTETTYTLTINADTSGELLVVGGGGGGGGSIGSGGGAGGLVYTSMNFTTGTYTIKVGDGGAGTTNTATTRGANGYNSSAFGYTMYGGGGGAGQSWVYNQTGVASGTLQTTSANQGSGAGGTRYKTTGNDGTAGQGNKGGNSDGSVAGGGGGAGGAGGNGSTSGAQGGAGINISITGTSVGYAGGGAGSGELADIIYGGLATHGGGSSGPTNGSGGYSKGLDGSPNTGGGGGGGNTGGGKGGSGVVILRYILQGITSIQGSSSIELIRGIKGDTSIDYKIGNYGGEFKIISSVNNTNTDVMKISSTGEVSILGLNTSSETKQATINSSPNQIIIGNGNGLTTTSANLTFNSSTNTLFATNFVGNGSGITGLTETQIPTLAISKTSGLQSALDAKQAKLTASTGINIDANNVITASGDQWTKGTNSSINYTAGNVGIGTTDTSIYKLNVGGSGTNRTIISSPYVGSYIYPNSDYEYMIFVCKPGDTETTYTLTINADTSGELLVVGGGGGGGGSIGSGGGAGGLVYTSMNFTTGTYTIKVGDGGAGTTNTATTRGANGYNSSAFGYTMYGGGGGAGQSWVYNQTGVASGTLQTTSANQGSGAGGTRYKTTGNDGTAGQGNKGGNSDGNVAGGGGGANGVGGNGSTSSAQGGAGFDISITGTSIGYAGGGAGSGELADIIYGGLATHGGGSSGPTNGSGGYSKGLDGSPNTGGGGGGGNTGGGKGGSGVVIIKYLPKSYIMNVNGGAIISNNLKINGEISSKFTSVVGTGVDYLGIQNNTTLSTLTTPFYIRALYNSFTGFHRVYTDDILFNEETPNMFKNDYMGRVVIATGKIKTDYTITDKNNEWGFHIDKDGITIEDALPIIQLSRKKKEKRIFGVIGDPTRNNSNPNKIIVNSVGEGGICVSNTNGNIENGDYIQSSDLLGYGEKQDDCILHNYTIAKATIDCNFELDSPYYQCHEIADGVRVAFISCSYHCG